MEASKGNNNMVEVFWSHLWEAVTGGHHAVMRVVGFIDLGK